MGKLKSILEALMRIEILISAILVISMVFLMCTEIVMRYIFNNSIIWVQEFAIVEFIWIVALCGNVVLMLRRHITVKTFSQILSENGKKYFGLVSTLFVFVAILYMIFYLPHSIKIQNKTDTSSLPINFGKGIYYSVPLFLSAIIMLVTQLYYFYYQICEICGKKVADDYELTWNK